jgi:hypothetical protein
LIFSESSRNLSNSLEKAWRISALICSFFIKVSSKEEKYIKSQNKELTELSTDNCAFCHTPEITDLLPSYSSSNPSWITDGQFKIGATAFASVSSINCNLTVNTSNIEIPSIGGNAEINIISNSNWSVSSDVNWIQVLPISGNNNDKLTISINENVNFTERKGIITINSCNLNKYISVIQPGNCYLNISKSSMVFPASGGSQDFTVTSNSTWKISSDNKWITINQESGSDNGLVNVSVSENTGDARSGKVTIIGCETSLILDIHQDEITRTSIAKIQGEKNISTIIDSYRRIKGTVTGVLLGKGYYVQDSLAAWSGIWVSDINANVKIGNGVIVDGFIKETDSITTLNSIKLITTTSTLNVTPLVLNSPEIAKDEKYENVLVRILGVRYDPSKNSGENKYFKTSENNNIFVGNSMFNFNFNGEHFYHITGIVNGEKSNYKIEPRNASDIVDLTIVSSSVLEDTQVFKIYPNPFCNSILIDNHEKATRLKITNVLGQTVIDAENPGHFTNTEKLIDGVYFITLFGKDDVLKSVKMIKNSR